MVEGSVMLVLTYLREFVKNRFRKKRWELPIHAFYEIYKEDTPLLFNLLLYFLPMAFGDHAFRSHESTDDLLGYVDKLEESGEVNEGVVIHIPFRTDVLKSPVYRPYLELSMDSSTGKARGADAFGKQFASLGRRAGFTRNLTPRGCRRWALMEAGMKYLTLNNCTTNQA